METRDTRKRPQKLVVLCETSGKNKTKENAEIPTQKIKQ